MPKELLTARETQIMDSVANGSSYKTIGEKLFISQETVKKHLKNIYKKLEVKNKIEAINKLNSIA